MAKAQRVQYVMATVDDRPGTLLKLMQDLKARNISLSGLWGFGTRDGKAQVYVVAKSPEKVKNAWRASGQVAEEGTAFFTKGTDRAGALLKTLEALANAGINVRAIHAVAVGGRYGSFLWIDPSDVEKAAKALEAR